MKFDTVAKTFVKRETARCASLCYVINYEQRSSETSSMYVQAERLSVEIPIRCRLTNAPRSYRISIIYRELALIAAARLFPQEAAASSFCPGRIRGTPYASPHRRGKN